MEGAGPGQHGRLFTLRTRSRPPDPRRVKTFLNENAWQAKKKFPATPGDSIRPRVDLSVLERRGGITPGVERVGVTWPPGQAAHHTNVPVDARWTPPGVVFPRATGWSQDPPSWGQPHSGAPASVQAAPFLGAPGHGGYGKRVSPHSGMGGAQQARLGPGLQVERPAQQRAAAPPSPRSLAAAAWKASPAQRPPPSRKPLATASSNLPAQHPPLGDPKGWQGGAPTSKPVASKRPAAAAPTGPDSAPARPAKRAAPTAKGVAAMGATTAPGAEAVLFGPSCILAASEAEVAALEKRIRDADSVYYGCMVRNCPSRSPQVAAASTSLTCTQAFRVRL